MRILWILLLLVPAISSCGPGEVNNAPRPASANVVPRPPVTALAAAQERFHKAFAAYDKAGVAGAFQEVQAIEVGGMYEAARLWRFLEQDFRLMSLGTRPNRLGFTEDEYNRLPTLALLRYGLTDPSCPESFAIYAHLYIGRRSDWDVAERVKLAGAALNDARAGENHSLFQRHSATALRWMPHPTALPYLRQFLLENRDNSGARKECTWAAARIDTPESWSLVKVVSNSDPANRVRETAEYLVVSRGIRERGFLIRALAAGGEGERAGLAVGDVIRRCNGVDVRYFHELEKARKLKPGSELEVTRDGQKMKIRARDGDLGITGSGVPPEFD